MTSSTSAPSPYGPLLGKLWRHFPLVPFGSAPLPARPQMSSPLPLCSRSSTSASPSGTAIGRGSTMDLGPMRWDAPGRRPYQRGAVPNLRDAESQAAALEALDADCHASSSAPAVKARRECVRQLLSQWQLTPFPITAWKLRALGASLKAGHYRSHASVVSQYKVDAEQRGQPVDGVLCRIIADINRSCRRGLGPPVRALALPFDCLDELPGGMQPWCEHGPVGSRNCMVVGSWWLLREIEASTLRACLVTLEAKEFPCAVLLVQASKSDTEALGVARAHSCICKAGCPCKDCPAHAVWDQLLLLRHLFPARHVGERPDDSLPLFPTAEGKVCSKSAMVATIVQAARHLGTPTRSPNGMLRLSGHSLRPTGAVGLSKLGLDLWTIQLLGRWGSDSVRTYVQEAAVSTAAAEARGCTLGIVAREPHRQGIAGS